MALEPTVLDDLSWNALVESSRGRIASASKGRWTLHAPVDPGVTLVELYAWLLEQRSFWLDQPDDATLRGLLTLLGENAWAPRAARTVLRARASDPTSNAAISVAGDTAFEMRTAEGVRTFSTLDVLLVLPLERVDVRVNGVDCSDDLQQRRLVPILPPGGGGSALLQCVLWLRQAVPASPGAPIGLLVELETPRAVSPGWTHDAASVPPAGGVRWTYSRGPGQPDGEFVGESLVDGTGSLRRSGVVQCVPPGDWSPEAPATGGLLPYTLSLQLDPRQHSAPPRLRAVNANVVVAHHEKAVRLQRSPQWLPLPGQVLDLDRDEPLPLATTVRLRFADRAGVAHTWTPVETLAFSGPGDRVFEVDREKRQVRFGDGLTGRIPRVSTQSPTIEVAYRAGGGTAGSIRAGAEWLDGAGLDLLATNVVEAAGGREQETFEAARTRVQQSFKRATRAVTAADYRTLATTTPGVAIARAHPAIGFHPEFPCDLLPGVVTVFVVPDVPRGEDDLDISDSVFVPAPLPDIGALAAVRARLDAARLAGTELHVCRPRYRDVAVAVRVSAEPARPNGLRMRVVRRLHTFLDPLAGGDDRRGWPFGEPIRPSALLREAQRAVGEEGEVLGVAIALDGAEPSDACGDQAIRPHELPVLRHVRVRLETPERPAGGLR